MKVGAIGLGIMGAPMTAHLMAAGHNLLVWNRSPAKAEPLLLRGATWVESPAELAAQRPEAIVINVTDTVDVREVLFSDQGIMKSAAPGLIIVDHSTINPVETRRIADQLKDEFDVDFVDAPVSGGDRGARNGSLSIMVGGSESAVAKVWPLLTAVGDQIVHLGPSGSGQACKACNQLSVVGALLGAVEAVTLSRALRLDPQQMIDVVSRGAGGSWQLENLGPKIAEGDHRPGFMVDYLVKDLAIVADSAESADLSLPLLELARKLYAEASSAGFGRSGTQAVAARYSSEPPSAGSES